LFAAGTPGQTAAQEAKRNRYKKSVLDFTLDSAATLRNKIGRNDQLKLDQHMAAVRDLESRIGNTLPPVNSCNPGSQPPNPASHEEYVKLMFGLMAMALQCDLTRVITFMYDHEASQRTYSFAPEGHHTLSHYEAGGTTAQINEKLQKIDEWRVTRFAEF